MPNHTLKFPMVGGESKFVLICTHVHKFPHTHTKLISRNGKEIEITHTLAKWGSVSRKNKNLNKQIIRFRFRLDRLNFSAGVDSLATPLGT